MKTSRHGALPTLSVLDRLLDDDPSVSREAAPTPHQVLRELKQAVRRDLENLLNTRVRNLALPGHLIELRKSVVSYGLPDFAGVGLASAKEREDFCKRIREVIGIFEPRLQNVVVTPVTATEPLDRTFRFRIEAFLRLDPTPEPVQFDSNVEPTTGGVEVKGLA